MPMLPGSDDNRINRRTSEWVRTMPSILRNVTMQELAALRASASKIRNARAKLSLHGHFCPLVPPAYGTASGSHAAMAHLLVAPHRALRRQTGADRLASSALDHAGAIFGGAGGSCAGRHPLPIYALELQLARAVRNRRERRPFPSFHRAECETGSDVR